MKKAVIVMMIIAMLTVVWSTAVYAVYPEDVPAPPAPWEGYNDAYIMYIKNDIIRIIRTKGDFYIGPTGSIRATDDWYTVRLDGSTWVDYSDGHRDINITNYADSTENFLHCTATIYTDSTLTTVARAPDTDNPYISASVAIPLPPDGYIDNSWLYVFWVYAEFEGITSAFDVDLMQVKCMVNGDWIRDLELYYKVVSNTVSLSGDTWVNQIQIEIEMPVGVNVLSVQYWYDGVMVVEATKGITRLSGFVDEDGDGLDDRTGKTDNSVKPVYEDSEDIEIPEKPEDGDVLAWIRYIGEMIDYIFDMIFGAIKNFAIGVADGMRAILGIAQPMFSFMRQFFESFPPVMSAGIIALVTVATVLGILKLIRG